MNRSRFLVEPIVLKCAAFTFNIALQAVAGVIVRSVVALVRRERAYFRIIRSAAWLTDTLRIVVFSAIAFFTYAWIKLTVPLYHPVLFDQQLWDLDQKLLGGLSPNILFLDLLRNRGALRVIDWSYANIFMISVAIAMAYFLSDASRRVRIAFANGHVTLWLAGAWLYLVVPSLGPAYRFPDVWLVHEHVLARTQSLQAMLMRNYQSVLRAASGRPAGPISIIFGIAAFPSMHVAFQTFVFLWMRRLWKSGEVLFGIFVFAIFLGSIITGWHYLIDGIAGIVLAVLCYVAFARAAKLKHWIAIKRRLGAFFRTWHLSALCSNSAPRKASSTKSSRTTRFAVSRADIAAKS